MADPGPTHIAEYVRVRCHCGYTVWVPRAEVPMHRRAFEKWCPHGKGGSNA